MANFNKRNSKEIMLLTGVKCGILSLTGANAEMISDENQKKREDGFENLLFDCIEYVGDKSKPALIKKDILKLCAEDRKLILFEVRRLSNKRNPDFIFDYEFPAGDKGHRERQRVIVKDIASNFPIRPFKWVREKMIKDYCDSNNCLDEDLTNETIAQIFETEIPEMYPNYKDMLDANYEQKITLVDAEVEVKYCLLTQEVANRTKNLIGVTNSNTHFIIHDTKYIEDEKALPLPYKNMSFEDLEDLRTDIINTHGKIETNWTIKSNKDETKVVQFDLTTIVAFFFPSLSI